MERPKTSNKKMSWFGVVSVFMLAIALAVGVSTNTQAATGSFDRDNYFPSYGDTNDFDRAWISVTDTSVTGSTPDTITVTVKAGSNSTSFVLLETAGTTTVFTTTGSTQSITYPVGTTSGYVEDFNAGSHNFPALGTSVVGLNLKDLVANTGGNASTGSDASLTVSSGNTLELLYGGSTLDTAVVKTNSGSFGFTPSSVSAVTTTSLDSANLIISLTDQDENLNPVMKDVIGFAGTYALLSGNPGTGSSRVEIEAIDQTTGSRLTSVVAQSIMLVETGNNTGVFTANGKVFGSTAGGYGNLLVGSSTQSRYTGGSITLGNTTAGAGPGAVFKIIEANSTGSIALVYSGPIQTGFGTVTLAYKADSSPSDASFSGYGTTTLGFTKVVAGTSSSTAAFPVSIFGEPNSGRYATSTSNLVKLIDGTNFCLVDITTFLGTSTGMAAAGDIYVGTNVTNAGSVSVTIDSFQLTGPRSGDSLKVSYLDEFNAGGTSGTVTGTVAYGVSGETGTLASDGTAPDINDLVSITVVDGNLNTSSSSKESVASGSSQWGGTTTGNRGDRLSVKNYSASNTRISLSHPDGNIVGTQTVRISSTDNTYVWMVPTSAFSIGTSSAFFGSTTVSLGTQTVDTVPLVRGSSSGATSFLSSASTSSFVATLDGLDNTVEISPDGTRWISIPIVETGANSSTFVGTIGFDYTAARLTTDTSASVTSLIVDYTGTTTLNFGATYSRLDSFIGTGSVVRIWDGSTQEFAEVTSPTDSILTVTKLSNSTSFDPDKTWVQVIGDDMSTARRDSNSAGTVFSRIGGYFGGTYRVRYNDAVGASNAYLGGDTLAITTTNFGFTTYTGSLSTDITGTSGPDTYVVVTLVDQDLNTSTGSKQQTIEVNSTTSGTGDIIFKNENGLGLPSGTSSGNVLRGFMNGGTAKIIYASTLSNILSSSVDQNTGGNTIDFLLVETDNDTGTFKGSFKLASGSSTINTALASILKVSSGNSVYVYYNDSPNATAADNSSSYTATSPITIETSLGVLSLSKDTAYLSGDNVVATLVDIDRNTSLTSTDTLLTALKVTGSNYSVGTDMLLNLVENGVNTGTFLATITTGTTTVYTSTGSFANIGTIKTVQGGVANVIYTDTSPSASSATKNLSFSASDATLAFGADSYSLASYALVTLVDAERNTSISTAQSLLSDVFIQTSSANSTKVRMVESGADTGTFLGSIQVASSGDTTEFSKIKSAEGDTLKINYIDEVNTTGSSRTVTDEATVTVAVTPTPTATATATPTATATATPTPTPSPAPTGSLPPFPSPAPTGSLPPFPSPAPTGSLPPFPSPIVSPTPTPTVCEADTVTISKTALKLKRRKSDNVTVTVTGVNDCEVEGETVTATINAAGRKRIRITPTSAATDASGAVTFTITAKKKTGNARVTFKAGSVKKSIVVRVRK